MEAMEVLEVKNRHHRYVDVSLKLNDKELAILDSGLFRMQIFPNRKKLVEDGGREIAEAILEYFEVSFEELKSKNRKKHLIQARMYVSAFLRKYTLMTFEQIGDLMERNHATILHLCKRHKDEMFYADAREKNEIIRINLIGANLIHGKHE